MSTARLLVALVFVTAFWVTTTILMLADQAGGQPRCDQHAGTGQCINPPVIWRPDYAG